MDYQKAAEQFIKQHEGIGYQSQPQIVAVRAFAEWLTKQNQLDDCPVCFGRGFNVDWNKNRVQCSTCNGVGKF